jgi:tRNA (guanine9-N1)-methyltransferase
MTSQLTRCHAENRRSERPVDIYITSLGGRLGERMDGALKGVHHRWQGVNISSESYKTVLNDVTAENLVYLTADSENVIHTLEKDKVYILGGLVDKNRYKVISLVELIVEIMF